MTRRFHRHVWLGCIAASVLGVQLISTAATDEPTPLTLGQPIERSLAGGQTHVYQLTLADSDVAALTVDQHGIDVVIRVEDPQGALLATFDLEARPEGHEPVIAMGDASGSVRIRVTTRYPKAAAGTYAIHIDSLHPATDRDRDVFALHKLATAAFDVDSAGKFGDAQQQVMQALAIADRVLDPNDPFLGFLLTRSGDINRNAGDTAAAERLFQRAVAVNEAAHGHEDPQTAYALLRQGALYTILNQFTKAQPLLDEALAITERTLGSEHPRVGTALMANVFPHQYLEDFEYVLPRDERALAIAEKASDPDDWNVIALVNNLGDLYTHMGQYDVAQPYVERAIAGIEKRFGADNWRVSNALISQAVILRERQQYDRALEVANRAYDIRLHTYGPTHPEVAGALIHLGHIYQEQGNYTKSLDAYQQALAITEARGPYFEYTRMALEQASDTYLAMGDVAHGLAYQTRANQQRAKTIELNLAIGSEREKLQYTTALADSNDSTISLHTRAAPDNPAAAAEALTVLLQRKGQVLDALSGSFTALRERMNADDRATLDQLVTATRSLATFALSGPGKLPLDDYKQQLASMQAKREQLEAEIGGRSTEFRARSLPVDVASVQRAIPDEAALIELAVYHPIDPRAHSEAARAGEPHYIAYVLRHDEGIRWKELGSAREIDEAVGALREALHDPARRDVKTLSRAVDEKVLRPIRPLVGTATRLLISPDGELNRIPFEALVDEHHRYAIERFSISYLTSGRDLLRLQLPRASKSAPLIVAAPAFGPALLQTKRAARHSVTTGPDLSVVYFAPLPGTAEEARAIKMLFPDATVLSGARATKSALAQAEAPELLHIATHGFFLEHATAPAQPDLGVGTRGISGANNTNSKNGTNGTHTTRAMAASTQVENPLLRAGLALTGANVKTTGKNDDGILTALEASTLNLWGTKLVTLSGCDTGVGDIKNGEGVYGLRRAFLLAGAETLVMSLWPVYDVFTRDVMASYYRGLKRGLGRGEALRQAQLALLASQAYRHPYYWATFIQAGDWRPFHE